jgi:hypothetical protein
MALVRTARHGQLSGEQHRGHNANVVPGLLALLLSSRRVQRPGGG